MARIIPFRTPLARRTNHASRSAPDNAFLPAALEILETPPSPVRIALLWTICLLAGSAVLWAYFGKIDIVATAQGKVQPAGRVKTIQSVETGRVGSINVINGTRVKRGDVLLELDAGDARSDETALAGSLASLRGEIARRRTLLDTIESWQLHSGQWRRAPTDREPALHFSISHSTQEREWQNYRAELAELRAGLNVLFAQRGQKSAEVNRLKQALAAQKALVETLSERAAMSSDLLQARAGTKAGVLETTKILQEAEVNFVHLNGQHNEAAAALTILENEADKLVRTHVNENEKRLTEALRQADELTQTLIKAERRRKSMTISSPIDGMVQASAVTTVGQVVTAGAELMRIVPENATLEVEAYLANRDVGFVEEGQAAVVKIEAFPFTRYGTVAGRVARVATDAIPEPDARQLESTPVAELKSLVPIGNAQRMQNLVFPITVALAEEVLTTGNGSLSLTPGMSAVVEIKTGQRRILEYLFSPLAEIGGQSLKER